MKNIHVVNGNSVAEILRSALRKVDLYLTNTVYSFNDILSVGPLFQIESKAGQQRRITYFSELMQNIDYDPSVNGITNNIISESIDLNFNEFDKVMVWHGNNAPERILKLLCCSIIENKKLYEVDITGLQTEERIPLSVGDCSPESIEVLLHRSDKITPEDYTKSIQEWDKIISSKSNLRVYNSGKIINVSENYYDPLIIEQCTNEFTPALKIVGTVIGKSHHLIGDTFLIYRLLYLVRTNRLKHYGDLNNIRTLLVKKP